MGCESVLFHNDIMLKIKNNIKIGGDLWLRFKISFTGHFWIAIFSNSFAI